MTTGTQTQQPAPTIESLDALVQRAAALLPASPPETTRTKPIYNWWTGDPRWEVLLGPPTDPDDIAHMLDTTLGADNSDTLGPPPPSTEPAPLDFARKGTFHPKHDKLLPKPFVPQPQGDPQ